MRRPAATSLGAVVLAVLLGASVRAVAESPARPLDAQRLVFLLEYVGTDYDGAVHDGAVLNQLEYGEVLRFTKQLIREYGASPGRSEGVLAGLRELEQSIERRAPAAEVWSATRRLLPEFARTLGGAARPSAPPNLANGRRLWAADCAPCHGPAGAGDGPASPDMEPPPTAFRGEYLDRLAPRQVYSAVSFGVDGTAMPSFQAYSEQQRWDVAFFVMTLRVEFDPRRPAGGSPPTLDEIAASSNLELLDLLRETRPDASPREVDYYRVNFASADGGGAAPGSAGGPSSGLAVAVQLQDVFSSVADRIFPRVVGVTSYVRDPAWSPEKLQAERGDAWMVSNPDMLRYPGFRPVRSGSGFLVDDEGYVLSCDHIVRDQPGETVELVDVELPDQPHYPTRIVGTEPTLDLAVLRIGDLPKAIDAAPLEIADSDRVQVGHWLIALGDPPGAEKTFSVGVVSAPPERQCYQAQISATRLQSSLAVPPGGQGGPVVDIHGQVVGMVVGGAPDGSPTAHVLPVNLVWNLYEALKVAQSRRSPWIGVSVLELPLLRKRLEGQPAKTKATIPMTGVYIDDVFDPSPASRVGVRPGDFLVALGGHKLLSVADFQTWLYVLGIGKEVQLDLARDGTPMQVRATIEVRPENATTR